MSPVEVSISGVEESVPWPCDSDVVGSFPLQVINTMGIESGPWNDGEEAEAVNNLQQACNQGLGTAQIKRLDLDTGTYTNLCNVVGVCLNACGIHPQTNIIYCNNRPGSDNLVRVDCDINITDMELRNQEGTLADAEVPTGTVCYLGRLRGTFAANLDENGEFWFKQNAGGQNGGDLYRITNATLNSVETTGQTDPFTDGRVPGAGNNEEVVGRPGLGRMADLNVVTRTFPELNVGEQDYVIGCWSNLVYVQQVGGLCWCQMCAGPWHLWQVTGDLTNVDPIVLTMRDIDPPPAQSNPRASGAQWLFNGTVYCAYNDGTLGGLQRTTGRVPVDFQVFAHYSGHASYTKGLLLVDRSGGSAEPAIAAELTSEDCRWRTKQRSDGWRMVDELTKPELLTGAEEMVAFKIARSKHQKMHVELLMKTPQGFKKVGVLYAVCKQHDHIDMKMTMFSKEDVRMVQGQLGGHEKASKEMDQEGPAVLKSCTEKEKVQANAICSKYLGSGPSLQDKEAQERAQRHFRNALADCVFDVCAGGGESAAELAADIMNAF
eukprot:Skav201086  [mRNA]  locus=scaffold2138:150458:157689:- [translate_table: standard]